MVDFKLEEFGACDIRGWDTGLSQAEPRSKCWVKISAFDKGVWSCDLVIISCQPFGAKHHHRLHSNVWLSSQPTDCKHLESTPLSN